jgi:hypothetical protein
LRSASAFARANAPIAPDAIIAAYAFLFAALATGLSLLLPVFANPLPDTQAKIPNAAGTALALHVTAKIAGVAGVGAGLTETVGWRRTRGPLPVGLAVLRALATGRAAALSGPSLTHGTVFVDLAIAIVVNVVVTDFLGENPRRIACGPYAVQADVDPFVAANITGLLLSTLALYPRADIALANLLARRNIGWTAIAILGALYLGHTGAVGLADIAR